MKSIIGFIFENIWRRSAKLSFLITLLLLLPIVGFAQTADFTADITTVCTGSNLTFTDNSSGTTGTVSYSWNFGDGASLGNCKYYRPSYDILFYPWEQKTANALTITDDGGPHTETKTDFITVYTIPVADAGVGGDECDLDFILNATATVGTGTWTVSGPGTASYSPNANTAGATATVSAYGT